MGTKSHPNNEAICIAAIFGRIDVLKCLREDFSLTAEDARARNNSALCESNKDGNDEVVKYSQLLATGSARWLHTTTEYLQTWVN